MKCHKCGSEIKENKDRDAVWDRGRTAFCNKCHIEYRIDDETNDIIYTQPTTAEMLLWLVKNITFQSDTNTIAFAFGWKEEIFNGDIDSQIKQAYEWVKKQEEQNV